jgi:arylsulfatase A-like enzyme
LEGNSLAALLANPSRPWKRAAFTVFRSEGQYSSIRTKRYRYSERQYGSLGRVVRELYDLEQDPWETVNLADLADQAELQESLASMLKAGWRAAKPLH